MGKKEKKLLFLEEELHELVRLIPNLKAVLKMLDEIGQGYQKHLKNGGAAIPVLEKYVGSKGPKKSAPAKDATAKDAADSPVKKKTPGGSAKKAKKEVAVS